MNNDGTFLALINIKIATLRSKTAPLRSNPLAGGRAIPAHRRGSPKAPPSNRPSGFAPSGRVPVVTKRSCGLASPRAIAARMRVPGGWQRKRNSDRPAADYGHRRGLFEKPGTGSISARIALAGSRQRIFFKQRFAMGSLVTSAG